jgi:hypothetical protein
MRVSIETGNRPANWSRRTGQAFCPRCEQQVELISFAGAAVFFQRDREDIDFLARRADLHRVHNRAGEVMICSNSLVDCFGNSGEDNIGLRSD